jgi:hypothetical protein
MNLDDLKAEIGPFKVWLATNPIKYTLALAVIAFVAGALIF